MSGGGRMEQLASGLIIFAGAAIMLASIVKWRQLSQVTPFIAERSRWQITRYLNLHLMLMAFFVLGYVGVATVFIFGVPAIGELVVSVIFLAGSIFVFLGILIQLRLLHEIQVTIRGLLPICSACKKVRAPGAEATDRDSWSEIESYITEKTQADISHSLCPDCKQRLYPDLD